MNLYPTLRAWVFLSVLFLANPYKGATQCTPPPSIWLSPPQTSTALVLKWANVPGVLQYQLRYWETANPVDKTIVDNVGTGTFTLRGLKKSTSYSIEVRSKCGSSFSAWSSTLAASTINSSGTCANIPTGVAVVATSSSIQVSWTSTNSHTIRYRAGTSGDWTIPTGANWLTSAPYTIPDLSPGTYQVEIKRNCSSTTGTYLRYTTSIVSPCGTPLPPIVTPAITSAMVNLPTVAGVIDYDVEYEIGNNNIWIDGGNQIPPSIYFLNPPLMPGVTYQIRIKANCASGSSGFSDPISFTTDMDVAGPCLSNRNAGINMSPPQIQDINQQLNRPSHFTYETMIAINDGGLHLRSFQNESFCPIVLLTKQLRNFHTMDEDFNLTLQNYALNLKPKQTIPEGTPAFTAKNKNFYTKYRQLGFNQMVGATELLQYAPQNWKEKIYQESDWSLAGPAGILGSYKNYTKTFIDVFAPANGTDDQILISYFQVGNEPWDYPIKADYQSLLLGAHLAFIEKYGPKSLGGWKMKLIVAAFQAYRENSCNSILRDFSNCGGGLERHDFIGEFLDLLDCSVLKDLDAVDCHPYSFKKGTNEWTYPEDPNSETWQIRNLAYWLESNRNNDLGILSNTQLWCTEFGFDSNPTTGVGEMTQSAYLLRGLLLLSRYHYEKVYFYNDYDEARPNDQYYNSLFSTAGFWKLGTHPGNSAWSSPLEAHGATPKPSWFGMMDFKNRFSEHVFYKALVEDGDTYAIIIAKPDGTEPYLVFWSPKSTNDVNIHQDIQVNKTVTWTGALPGNYKIESLVAQSFAESTAPGQVFLSAQGTDCGNTTLVNIRRSPSFIRLVDCIGCSNITNAGSITVPNPQSGSSPFNPGVIQNAMGASGGTAGSVLYQWQQSTDDISFLDVPGAVSGSYDPPSLTQTTYFRRAARRSDCPDFGYTSSVVILVGSACPVITTFNRVQHISASCNNAGDYYYEISLQQVSVNDQITIEGLPSNGININMSMLNGVGFTPATYQSNLQFINSSSLKWLVNTNNGASQTLRLYYCWANTYPVISVSKATSMCSGTVTPCAIGFNAPDPEGDKRSDFQEFLEGESFGFKVWPNPGTEHISVQYKGPKAETATIRIVSLTGQCLYSREVSDLEQDQALELYTSDLSAGIYFISLHTAQGLQWATWQRI